MKPKLQRNTNLTCRRTVRLPLLLVCCFAISMVWFSSPTQKMTEDVLPPVITADTLLPRDEPLRTHIINTRTMANESANFPCQFRPQQTNLQPCKVPFPTKFYSEGGQDRYVLDKFFRNRCDGTFIELGATRGIRGSNTKMLEDSLKWTGTCIEPNPTLFASLQRIVLFVAM